MVSARNILFKHNDDDTKVKIPLTNVAKVTCNVKGSDSHMLRIAFKDKKSKNVFFYFISREAVEAAKRDAKKCLKEVAANPSGTPSGSPWILLR